MNNLIGQSLGKYQIVAPLGQGGMARVYKGYQSGLDRYVAIKLLHPYLIEQENFVARFEREATLVARLRHPNIVQVYDFETAENGLYYMVMEYIEGPTLRMELEGRLKSNEDGFPFTLEEISQILYPLAQAIDYAHSRGMIHRDLKPGNVIFTPEGHALLADFGLSYLMSEATRQTQEGAITGTPAYMSPEQCRGEVVDGRSDIYALSVILYELLTGHAPFRNDTPLGVVLQHLTDPFPLLNSHIPPAVQEIIAKASRKTPANRYQTAVEFAQAFNQAIGITAESAARPIHLTTTPDSQNEIQPDTTTRRSSPADSTPHLNPYRGLYAFREEDAPFFFGRELFTERLVRTVQEQAMVAVVGPSGSGKSSVVFAGMIPRLKETGDWLIIRSRPGSEPFQALATALIPHLEPETSETGQLLEAKKLAAALEGTQLPLYDVIKRILAKNSHARRLLLIADQFEELFTLCQDTQDQRNYPTMLFEAIKAGQADGSQAFSLALTLRADFVGQALGHRPFADALQDHDIKLGPMTREELGKAIENPAKMQGVIFEPGLVDRILDDVGREPGNLPLLEFALTLLWDKRSSKRLNHSTYEAIGRVEGSLARYADEIYAGLSDGNKTRARRVFTQMVRPGEGTEDTRRVAQRAELSDEDWALVNYLANARLLVTGRSPEGHKTAEIVHEALIRGWSQLRSWMNEDRTFRAWQERLRGVLRQWESSQRDEGALLRGALLAEAQEWLIQRPDDLGPTEEEFIQASLDSRQRELTAQETVRQRELEAARQLAEEQRKRAEVERQRANEQAKTSKRLRSLSAVLAGIFVLAVVVAIFATYQRQQATAAQATAVAEAHVRATAEANAMHNAQLAATREAEAITAQAQAEVERDRANQEETAAMIAKEEAEVERDRADQQAEIALARQLAAQSGILMNDQLDLALLLSMEAINTLPSPETLGSLLNALQQNPQLETMLRADTQVLDVRFSRDGNWIVSAGEDGQLWVWDAHNRQLLQTLVGHDATKFVNSSVFTKDGRILISASDDETIRFWDTQTWQPVGEPLIEHRGFVQTLDISPDGTILASAGGDNDYDIRLWDVMSRTLLMPPLRGHTNTIWHLLFSPDGTLLATGSADSSVRLWNVETGEPIGEPLTGHTGGVARIAFSPNGRFLASGGADGLIVIWDVTSGQPVGEPLTGHAAAVNGVVFSQDGNTLYSASTDTSLLVWDMSSYWSETPLAPVGQSLLGHTAPIYNLNIAPDGNQLVSGDSAGTIIVWNIAGQSWPAVQTFTHPDSLQRVDLSQNGQYLASAGGQNQVVLWDLTADSPISRTLIHAVDPTMSIEQIAISPDGQRLVSASRNGTMQLWNLQTGEVIAPNLVAAIGGAPTVAFSQDGRFLVTGYGLGLITWWDGQTGDNLTGAVNAHTAQVNGFAFHPLLDMMASVGDDGWLILHEFNVDNQSLLQRTVRNGERPLLSVAFSPDGGQVAAGNDQGLVTVWDVATGELVQEVLLPGQTAVLSLAYHPQTGDLVAGYADGAVMVWDFDGNYAVYNHPVAVETLLFDAQNLLRAVSHDGQMTTLDLTTGTTTLTQIGEGVSVVGVTGDGKTAVFSQNNLSLTRWDIETGQPISDVLQHTAVYTTSLGAVAFNPDSTLLASAGFDGVINLWDVATGQLAAQPLVGHMGFIWDVAFSPDGSQLASLGCRSMSGQNAAVCLQGEILLWDLHTWQPRQLTTVRGQLFDLAFSPDGALIFSNGCYVAVDAISGCLQGAVYVFDATTGHLIGSPIPNNSIVRSLAVSPDGRLLATGDFNSTVTLWDITNRYQIGQRLIAHNGPILSLAFSPDGSLLVSTSVDDTVALWDVATGQVIGRLFGHGANVMSVVFGENGNSLITGDANGQILVWDINISHWLNRACQVANRNITPGEWERFFGETAYHLSCFE